MRLVKFSVHGMKEIDDLIEFHDLNKEEEKSSIRLVGNDDMDYEI